MAMHSPAPQALDCSNAIHRDMRQRVGANRRAAGASCRKKEFSDKPNSDR